MTLQHTLQQAFIDNENAIALDDGTTKMDYKILSQRINQVRIKIEAIPYQSNVIAIALSNSIDAVIAITACYLSGKTFLPLNIDMPKKANANIIRESLADCVITLSSNTSDFIGCQRLEIDTIKTNASTTTASPNKHKNDRAYIIYTSGSTGQQKGVVISNKSLTQSTDTRIAYYQDTKPKSFALLSPLFFDSSFALLFWSLATGSTLHLFDLCSNTLTQDLFERMNTQRITHTLCVPSLYQAILEYSNSNSNFFHTVILAGEDISTSLLHQHIKAHSKTALYNEYGPSEATIWASVAKLHNPTTPNKNPSIHMGSAIPGTTIYIVNEHHQLVKPGEIGELYIEGFHLAQGYLSNNPIKNEAFTTLKCLGPQKRLYKTGDYGYFNEENQLVFTGRQDQQIKINGRRVNLKQLEIAAQSYPDIVNAHALVQCDNERQQLALFIQSNGFHIKKNDITYFLHQEIPHYLLPQHLITVEHFPTLANGKIDNDQLRAQLKTQTPSSRTTKTLNNHILSLISPLINISETDLDIPLYAVGIDSILLIRIVSLLTKNHFSIDLNKLNRNMLLREFINAITNKRESVKACEQKTTRYPLLAGQKGIATSLLLHPNTKHYFLHEKVTLSSNINSKALEKSINTVIDQHPGLRIVISNNDAELYQYIGKNPTITVDIFNVTNNNENEVISAFFTRCNQRFSNNFTPLMSFAIIKGAKTHLLIHASHLVIDGWSMTLLINKILASYLGNNNNMKDHYIAYLENEQKSNTEQAKQYWRDTLQNKALPTVLKNQSLNNNVKNDKVELHNLILQEKSTAYSLESQILLSLAIYAQHRLQKKVLCFGVVSSGRLRNIENSDFIIGMLANTLPLPIEINQHDTIEAHLQHITNQLNLSITNDSIALSDIIKLTETATTTDLFDTIVTFQNNSALSLNDDLVDKLGVHYKPSIVATDFALTLRCIIHDNQIQLQFIYNPSAFSADDIETMAEQINCIYKQINNLSTPLMDIALVDESDYDDLFEQWNN